MNITVTVEKKSAATKKLCKALEHLADNTTPTIDNVLSCFEAVCLFGSGLKTGRGGSHVWVSNAKNERLLIVTFQ